jgi:RNA polymerase sigma-70 factor (ECF subfamily)
VLRIAVVPPPESVTAELWSRFRRPLYAYLIRQLGGDTATADDLLQEVFVRVHRRIGTLRDEERLTAWLYRIARNVAVDHLRGAGRLRMGEELPEIAVEEEDGPRASERLAPAVRAMIEQLAPEAREALLATEYEGLTQAQLAARLGLSLSGAKSRVQRARSQLEQMMLDCCHFELDRRGGLIAYRERRDCCADRKRPSSD